MALFLHRYPEMYGDFPNSIAVYSQLLSRRCWGRLLHEGGGGGKEENESKLGSVKLYNQSWGKVLLHDNIEWRFKELFKDDGVHLTDKGNDLYIGNLKKAFRESSNLFCIFI